MKKRSLFLLIISSFVLTACNRMGIKHFHYYDPASQQWDVQYDENGYPSSATVTVSCTNEDKKCDELTKTLEATIVKEYVQEPNCCEEGTLRYIAQANFGDTTYSKAFDYAISRTDHIFDHYHTEKDGHAKECSFCKTLEAPIVRHDYGDETKGEAYYTCPTCGYVDADRKEYYLALQDTIEINELIEVVEFIPVVLPYHEFLIRDIDAIYGRLKDKYRYLVPDYESVYLPFKGTYESKYKIIFDDITDMVGFNTKSAAEDTEVEVTKNQPSIYGYGFNFKVNTPSADNCLKYYVSKPSYSETDNYEGVIYTHNVPEDITLVIQSGQNDAWMVGGYDNESLGDGWIARKINATRMKNLINNGGDYTFVKYLLGRDSSQVLQAGNYFISCLYAIKPDTPTTGKHYAYKDSTESAPGNKEYWQYDGQSTIYLTNPDLAFNWTEGVDSPTLSSSSPAYIAKKGTINVDTVNATNWKDIITNDPQGFNKLLTGTNGSAEQVEGGLYTAFINYQYNGWPEDRPGVAATYTLPSTDDMKYVNKLALTYYCYEPTSPMDVIIKAIDQEGNEVEIINDTFEHTASPVTTSFTFTPTNIYKLKVTTKAFEEGKGGYSKFLIKDVSLSYDSTAPVPTGDVNISTTDDSKWTYQPASTNVTQNKIAVGIKNWWDESQEGDYLAMRLYQHSEWDPTVYIPGLTATFTNSDIKKVNKLEFKYFIHADNYAANNLTLKISIVGGGKTTLVDTLTLDSTVTKGANLDYSKAFGEDLIFEQLKLELSADAPKGTNGNTIIFLKEMKATYN